MTIIYTLLGYMSSNYPEKNHGGEKAAEKPVRVRYPRLS
jgi:hypothetical protein